MKNETGYWIECIPVRKTSLLSLSPGLYQASIDDFPDIKAIGISPDRAITKLRRRLDDLRRTYEERNEELPSGHSRLKPPQRLRGVDGWMSVYLELRACNIGTA